MTGARRGCRRPLGGPARSEDEAAAASPGRFDGLLGGVVESVAEKPVLEPQAMQNASRLMTRRDAWNLAHLGRALSTSKRSERNNTEL